MTETTIFEPKYVLDFECWGGDCPASCCHSWKISVDKKSFKSLRKHSDSQIKQLAKTWLKRDGDGMSDYGKIQFKPDGTCPMLDDQEWCEIHKRCGHTALPVTCQVYPRRNVQLGDRVEQSLNLSCPAAAKLILTDPEAMMLRQRAPTAEDAKSVIRNVEMELPQWFALVRDFCFDLLLHLHLPVQERLFALGMALKQCEAHLEDPARLESFFSTMLQMVGEGAFSEHYAKVPALPELKWRVFAQQDRTLAQTLARQLRAQKSRTAQNNHFLSVQQPMLQALANPDSPAWTDDFETIVTCNVAAPSNNYERIVSEADQLHLRPFFEANPQIQTNFLLYYVYHNLASMVKNDGPFAFFKTLVAEQLLLDSYLAGLALKNQGVITETLVNLYSAYSRRRQHESHFVPSLQRQLDHVEKSNPAIIFSLLK